MALLHFCSIHSAETHVLVMSPFFPMFYCNQNNTSECQLWHFNPGSTFTLREAACYSSQVFSRGTTLGFETWLWHFLAKH